jgi:hypothetical protein
MLLVDERCLQPDLVGADRIVPTRTFQSTRTRRRREQYMPLVAFRLSHFLADVIICMCEFDFRQAQRFSRYQLTRSPRRSGRRTGVIA